MSKIIVKQCKACGREFNTYFCKNQRYCSRNCFYSSCNGLKEKTCKTCNKKFKTYKKKEKYCSKRCSDKAQKGTKWTQKHKTNIIPSLPRKEKHWNWKGGRSVKQDGYVLIKKPEHPNVSSAGYVSEHRFVMEQHIGRYLKKDEIVHHKGTKYLINSYQDRQDNRIENLDLLTRSEHIRLHNSLRRMQKHIK